MKGVLSPRIIMRCFLTLDEIGGLLTIVNESLAVPGEIIEGVIVAVGIVRECILAEFVD